MREGGIVKPNIYLVGLMGCGKTTVGKLLASRMKWSFLDSDQEVVRRTGVSIPTIFEIEGEVGFRKREAQVLLELSQKSHSVVATGGGAVLATENREILTRHGYVVFLDVPPETLFERTRHDRNRPLIQVGDPLQKLRDLYAERLPLYRSVADLTVEGQKLGAHGIVARIQEKYQEQALVHSHTSPNAHT